MRNELITHDLHYEAWVKTFGTLTKAPVLFHENGFNAFITIS